MSASKDEFTTWQPPSGKASYRPPLAPIEKLGLFAKGAAVIAAEIFNWVLHTANYSLVNTVGSDVFLVDILGLPPHSIIQDVTVGTLLNAVLGLGAVATPVFLFSQLLDRHEEMFEDSQAFFKSGLTKIVTALLGILYFFVVITEFMALYLRVVAESAPSPIIDVTAEPTGFWPMLLMSLALILINAAMGLATAHVMRSIRLAFKGE